MSLINQIRGFIIAPALKACSLWCEASEVLLTGTLMMETNAEAVKQVHGPALGMFQIEPITHEDIKKYLMRTDKQDLHLSILHVCNFSDLPNDDELICNIKYSCLIARIIYWRNHGPLPDVTDRETLAHIYKSVYNTTGGKADLSKCLEIFKSISCNV